MIPRIMIQETRIQSVIPSNLKQRWAPGAYNPRALGVSLGISGHRTDLVQGNISTRPGSCSYRASTHLRRIENGQEVSSDRAVRVDSLKYSVRVGYGSESQPNVCNVMCTN